MSQSTGHKYFKGHVNSLFNFISVDSHQSDILRCDVAILQKEKV